MGGRAGGTGSGFGRGSVSNLTINFFSRFSDNQKTVYDQLVSGGVDKSYSAVVVSQWEKSFKQQPMQYIQNVMAQKVINSKDSINAALKSKVNKQGLLNWLKSRA